MTERGEVHRSLDPALRVGEVLLVSGAGGGRRHHRRRLLRGVSRFRVPPLVVVVQPIVTLLPGLDIYRGLALGAGGRDGVLQLASAFATALALAAGVILGQYLAQPLKREARRLEARLSGPARGRPLPKAQQG